MEYSWHINGYFYQRGLPKNFSAQVEMIALFDYSEFPRSAK